MAYIYNFTDTWTNAATTYDGIKLEVVDTASNSNSNLINLRVAGAFNGHSIFRVDKIGQIVLGAQGGSGLWTHDQAMYIGSGGSSSFHLRLTTTGVNIAGNKNLVFNGVNNSYDSGGPAAVQLRNEGSFTGESVRALGVSFGTNPTMFRVYNTYTNTSNYERAQFAWQSNVLTIGTEAAGTGTKRNLVLDSANRSPYIASPTAAEIRDILISFGLMAPS